ncbi:hypothetical protein [Fortiea sp. LEGE XX443]|uniref:hypothetical protein n=1 Tax=Fortiea sp. LEGE XX443 TaxID=1828611 RepID=UPI00403F28CE
MSKNAPPIPTFIRSPQQEVILTAKEIQAGQETYLARDGQHIGSIWGHGSYLAPDWTADFLHRWGLATAGVLAMVAFTVRAIIAIFQPPADVATSKLRVS